jgi:Cu/Ag efflux protein CusF
MIARLYRPLVTALLPVALIACMNSPPTSAEPGAAVPLGIDLGGSGPVIASAQPELPAHAIRTDAEAASPQHRDMRLAHVGADDAHGTGNSVDPAQHKVNLNHQPIPEIGWPAMTMEFPVAPSIDLTAIKPGTRQFYDRAAARRHVRNPRDRAGRGETMIVSCPPLTRRRFMQGAAAAGALALIPSPLRRALAAPAPVLSGTEFALEIGTVPLTLNGRQATATGSMARSRRRSCAGARATP